MKRIRDATTIIGLLDRGEVKEEFSKQTTDTLAALKESLGGRKKGKAKGSVTLTLNFEVEGSSVSVDADIRSKRPHPVFGSSMFFVLDDGTLSTEHPQQEEMFGGPRDAAGRHAAE